MLRLPTHATPASILVAVAGFLLTAAGCTSFPVPSPDSEPTSGWGGDSQAEPRQTQAEQAPPPPAQEAERSAEVDSVYVDPVDSEQVPQDPDYATSDQEYEPAEAEYDNSETEYGTPRTEYESAAPATSIPLGVPSPEREFRGVWIATVANIDWPSSPNLSTQEQQSELRTLFDRIAAAGFNAVVFQVRTTADALYDSSIEPWSEYLTGRQGQAPQPYYDPLELAVELAHERGLELHAWFNPYRAKHRTARSSLAATHVSRTNPGIVRDYGAQKWLDPGEPAAADHSMSVIMDVLRRYDIDGVHLDDYFYPYPVNENGRKVSFPDAESYRRSGSSLSRDDWRRDNVNRFIERLYREVKAEKSWVKVGISPFGIWRPGHPPSVRGFDQYEEIYADARLWQQEGWLDYFAPQLYWKIDQSGQRFPDLLGWWAEQNTADRHLWPGLFTGRIRSDTESNPWDISEILNQIEMTADHPVSTGTIHFSAKSIRDDSRGIASQLAATSYAEPALVPASPWLGDEQPGGPAVEVISSTVALTPTAGPEPFLWVIRTQTNGTWTLQIEPNTGSTIRLSDPNSDQVVVSGVSRTGIEGEMTAVDVE